MDQSDKKEYRVLITETLQKTVIVEAASEQEAHQRVSDAWQNGEYLLDGKDFDGAEFHVLGESEETEDKRLEHVDGKNVRADEDGND